MRKLITLLALVAIFTISSPAFATGNCNGNGDDCNSTYNTTIKDNFSPSASAGASAVGVGVGLGGDGGHSASFSSGGDASIKNSGNSSSYSQGGNAEVGNGFGNFSPDATSIQGQDQLQGQLQGQQQGQVGINEQGQSQSGYVSGKQGQDQFGYVETDLDITDNSDHSIDNDFPVNTAAPVFAGNCAQGVSAQTSSFGGSIASGNSVCDFIAVAGAYIAGGDRDNAFRVLGKAEKAADWRFFFSRVRMAITLGLL
jgi:hypothetical protein